MKRKKKQEPATARGFLDAQTIASHRSSSLDQALELCYKNRSTRPGTARREGGTLPERWAQEEVKASAAKGRPEPIITLDTWMMGEVLAGRVVKDIGTPG